jgi:hypothetical protein
LSLASFAGDAKIGKVRMLTEQLITVLLNSGKGNATTPEPATLKLE